MDFRADGSTILPASKLGTLHKAVIAKCADPKLNNDLIQDPATCACDPASLKCADNKDSSSCLTSEQVDVVRKAYAGALRFRDGLGRAVHPEGGAGAEFGAGVRARARARVPALDREVGGRSHAEARRVPVHRGHLQGLPAGGLRDLRRHRPRPRQVP
ncbi:tannase/feruloyl esterase family alpha/beta hydrolase [Streptomyces sp. NBC_01515]|uniref:tannase/feruloyl esterase family alpha/beta hydrolase n=1 Tax=Streptomyces sp. NBC_01515 TaxID=2903890 RepID=UPI003866DAFF